MNELERGGLHPYVKVLLYIIGYFVVALALSIFGAMVVGVLTGTGVVEIPAFDTLAAADLGFTEVEEIIKIIEPYLFHLIVFMGLYSIVYTWAFIRIVDRRPLVSLGLYRSGGWLSDFVKGVVLAALLLGVIFLISIWSGSITVEGFARPAPEGGSVVKYFFGILIAFLFVGFYEEIMFRGYILQRLMERSSVPVAVILSSIVFALLHGANPGADLVGLLNTVVISVMLSALYLRTRSLWMPIGFHFAWDFFLGYVYSLPVSGIPLYGLLDVVEVDPASNVSGGSYGPEAGFACTIALGIWAAWLIWRRTVRR